MADGNFDEADFSNRSSIKSLLQNDPSIDIRNTILGDNGIGNLITEDGGRALPNLTDIGLLEIGYFSGGHNTVVHGSREGGTIDAFQIENNSTFINNGSEKRADYVNNILGPRILEWFEDHYGFVLRQ